MWATLDTKKPDNRISVPSLPAIISGARRGVVGARHHHDRRGLVYIKADLDLVMD